MADLVVTGFLEPTLFVTAELFNLLYMTQDCKYPWLCCMKHQRQIWSDGCQ